MAAIASSTKLRTELNAAVWSVTRSRKTGNRGIGEEVERELASRLKEDVQREIEAEALTKLNGGAPSFGQLKSIAWEATPTDRHIADFLVTVSGTRRTSTIPVNLKMNNPDATNSASWQDACAVSAVIRIALGMPLQGKRPMKAEQLALELLAGERRIHRNAGDYFMVTAVMENDGSSVAEVCSQGLLSSVMATADGFAYAMRRNSVRPDTFEFVHSTLLLPKAFDVNRHLALALLPRITRPFQAEALTVSKAVFEGATPAELSDLSAALLKGNPYRSPTANSGR